MGSVLGIGMVSSLGLDVRTACAAARAGVLRASVQPQFETRSAVDGWPEAVVGHGVDLLTQGFVGAARLARLAEGAVADLLREAPWLPSANVPTGLYVALPPSQRPRTGAAIRLADGDRAALEQSLKDDPPQPPDTAAAIRLARTAVARAGLRDVPAGVHCSFAGHAGAVESIARARADLASGRVQLALVLAVDSLLDVDTLVWLAACGRLKCDGAPAGLQPGEAAAAAVLASPAAAARIEGATTTARIVATQSAVESASLLSGGTSTGRALVQVVAPLTLDADAHAAGPWIVSDFNGEVYRATELGYALARLRANSAHFDAPDLWYPAASFGDTGAASGLVGLATCTRAWQRGYAPAPSAIVVSAADGEARGAMLVARG